ncbi:MAG: hypothetical protein LPK26_04685 [Bacillaceae bacterium]|nr:hypothetical protein [Bacillaceae bacterium]
MAEDIKLQYGMCNIYVDGIQEFKLQGDVAEFSAEPEYEDIDLYEIPHYDKVVTGWNVTFKVVLEDNSYQALKAGLPMLEETIDDTTGDTISFTDGKLMQRGRDKAKELRIHPRELDEADTKFDLTIFKAFPVSAYEKKFGKELSKWEIEFVGLSKTADPKAVGNYFKIGE